MNPILEAKNITKAYEGRAILENISLDLVKGDVHVLLGPSGSGKTSLLRILAGLLDSDSGEVLLDGEAIESITHLHRVRFAAICPVQLP